MFGPGLEKARAQGAVTASVQTTLDEEYIDGYHGSDRVYARLALHLAEESETLAGLIDTEYLTAALAPSSSPLRLAQ